MTKRVNNRLFFTGLVCIVLAALAASLFYYHAFSIQVRRDVAGLTKAYAYAYEQAPESFPGEIELASHARLTLIASDGSVLWDSEARGEMENHARRPEFIDALAYGAGSDERVSSTLSVRTFYEAALLSDGNVLRVAVDTASIYTVFLTELPWLVGVLCLLAALSFLISRRLTRSLVQPIVAMGQHLDEIERYVPYPELAPLAKELAEDRAIRENHEKIRREFTANVSHELKTPLTSISGYAELLANGMVRKQDIPGFAGQIQREAARMIALVSDIIQLTELESGDRMGEKTPEWEMVKLDGIASHITQALRFRAQKVHITLTQEGEPVTVQGNPSLLEELCENLVENAIRYNLPGGRVIVSTGTVKGQPFLRVQDNGIGIPKEAQSRVFERFYRVDKSRSKATGGTGLGLAIVKHIALLHNAAIELESQVGAGTTMTVVFPKNTDKPAKLK